MWVKPVQGRLFRDYRTMGHRPEGEPFEVDDNDFVFAQMISHGDLVACEAPSEPEPAQAEPKAKPDPKPAPAATAEADGDAA